MILRYFQNTVFNLSGCFLGPEIPALGIVSLGARPLWCKKTPHYMWMLRAGTLVNSVEQLQEQVKKISYIYKII